MGCPDLLDRMADETVGTTEDEILPFLTEKKHPALSFAAHYRIGIRSKYKVTK